MRNIVIATMLICVLGSGCAYINRIPEDKTIWEERPVGTWQMVHQWDLNENPVTLKEFSLTLSRLGTYRSTMPATGDQGTYTLDRKKQWITMSMPEKNISLVMHYSFQKDYMTLIHVGFLYQEKGKPYLNVHSNPNGFIMKWQGRLSE